MLRPFARNAIKEERYWCTKAIPSAKSVSSGIWNTNADFCLKTHSRSRKIATFSYAFLEVLTLFPWYSAFYVGQYRRQFDEEVPEEQAVQLIGLHTHPATRNFARRLWRKVQEGNRYWDQGHQAIAGFIERRNKVRWCPQTSGNVQQECQHNRFAEHSQRQTNPQVRTIAQLSVRLERPQRVSFSSRDFPLLLQRTGRKHPSPFSQR